MKVTYVFIMVSFLYFLGRKYFGVSMFKNVYVNLRKTKQKLIV